MDELRAGMDALAASAPEEIVRNFATVGTVYEDGIALIFDGEETESEKHYLCNTGVTFQAGDRVRILHEAGTYIVEYVVGPPGGGGGGGDAHGIPAGGTAGQMLAKASGTDYDAAWQDVPTELPSTSASVAGKPLLATNGGSEWKEYIPQKAYNHGVGDAYAEMDTYVIQIKTGGRTGTAASEFYIRAGTSGTWHKITTT